MVLTKRWYKALPYLQKVYLKQPFKEKKIDIKQAFQEEIRELGIFLEALEEKYQELKKEHPVGETMQKLVKWMRDKK